MKNNLHVVILAGGFGTRFWPLSRESYPKQFLCLFGNDTMLQKTYKLARRFSKKANSIHIITNAQQADGVRMQIPLDRGKDRPEILLEPVARNTAAAIGWAATKIFAADPDAVMIVMPSDHVIAKKDMFGQIIRKAVQFASKDYLITFGIRPTRPETGFGYLKVGKTVQIRNGVATLKGAQVERFIEKPDLFKARSYHRRRGYYWNSGIFVFKAIVILEEIRKFLPKLSLGLSKIKASVGRSDEKDIIQSVYHRLRSISIDYGVMEKVERQRLIVLPADIGWNDVGSWSALHEILPRDRKGNIIRGNVIDVECENSILYAGTRPVAVIGGRDIVVVDTPDATLVCDINHAQDVRKVVDVLRKRGAEEQLSPLTVNRPWGSYTVLESGPGYKIKRIEVLPGARLSLQLHHHRSEHWIVVEGLARVTRNDDIYDVKTHESTYIPKGARHRIQNPRESPLTIIEVQNGHYLGEDDIVRFQDDYGRDVKR